MTTSNTTMMLRSVLVGLSAGGLALGTVLIGRFGDMISLGVGIVLIGAAVGVFAYAVRVWP